MKRGSALLIVLGMMTFMVVSAVAFSMFMRQNRLPSSFLRQRISASQLAKAALANAMGEIDAAIGDNPYPGVGNEGSRNVWRSRVFMGDEDAYNRNPDDELVTDDSDTSYETVSTLTLEALAYLPPPLVDTVRFWSRRTRTAAWAPLAYDAGRYAYTAVNVSDYFDINRLCANVMRDSSPSNRISLAYLFENDAHTGSGTVSPKAFDDAMKKTREDEYKTRLVSLADYNLSLKYGDLQASGFVSPFCEYIQSPPGDGSFFGSTEKKAQVQKFVTDSWYPGSLTNSTALVLTDAAAQPLEGLAPGLDALLKNGNAGFNAIMRHLNIAESAALVDYIDTDNVPTSLALPTMERVPSLTGLQIVPTGFMPDFDKQEIEGEVIPATATEPAGKWMHRIWTLKSLGDAKLLVGGSVVYPFKRKSGLSEKTTYDVEILVKMMLARTGDNEFVKTRQEKVKYGPGTGNWGTVQSDVNNAFWAFSKKTQVSVRQGTKETDAIADIMPVTIDLPVGNKFPNQVFAVKYKQMENEAVKPEDYIPTNEKLDEANCLRYRNGTSATPGNIRGLISDKSPPPDLQVRFFVWVRILDGNNTVDLVPATIGDDQVYNGLPVPPSEILSELGNSSKEPVLPIEGPTLGFKFNNGDLTAAPGEAKGLRIYCNDPRFNWAPEDWFLAGDDASISGQGWLDEVRKAGNAPNDIFQFVSNEGYLQSMGEIQFLPLVRTSYGDFSDNDPISGQFIRGGSSRYDKGEFATGIGAVVNRNFMWKTRAVYGDEGRAARAVKPSQDPYDWGILDTRGGVTVSPYADADMLMAAFANTPYDWIVASENTELTLDAGRKYCFGPSSSEAKIEWKDLQQIATSIKNEIGSNVDWMNRFRDANGWDSDDFFGVNLGDEFHDVDRKFLYSYWRNCLGNDQQLFLVFVRAEPTVMGGGSANRTLSQLGARAVALVWREPVSTIPSNAPPHPHRMRILFYHQFE